MFKIQNAKSEIASLQSFIFSPCSGQALSLAEGLLAMTRIGLLLARERASRMSNNEHKTPDTEQLQTRLDYHRRWTID